MNIFINYQEISAFIERMFKLRPTFSRVDEKSIVMSYKPSAALPGIDVKFNIEAMRKDVVCMSYECGEAASSIISGIVVYLDSNMPRGLNVKTQDKRVDVYPMNFKPLDGMWDYVTLSKITFEEKHVNLEFSIVARKTA
jgi:hypothetical protein